MTVNVRAIRRFVVPVLALLGWIAYPALSRAGDSSDAPSAAGEPTFTGTFLEQPSDLASTGRNPYFILEPGYTLILGSAEPGESVELVITVLNETRMVDGVETRIVEERESEDGDLAEVSRNYFVISRRTDNVYYFGEDSKTYNDGKVSSRSGSWEAGAKGARYGMLLPGCALVGSRYYQEIAPGEAMDRAENVSTSETLQVPAGTFHGCLKTLETSPLEPHSREFKYYAPGVGLIRDSELVLRHYGFGLKSVPSDKQAR